MKNFYRGLVYCAGMIILSLGIILNTKTGLGVSPIISIPYSISKIWNVNLGDSTAVVYILCVALQMVLRGKKFRAFDLLQIPMSIVVSRIINFFNDMIVISYNNIIAKFILLVVAILLTGIGVVMTVQTKFVPNAADGFTQAFAERIGIGLGLAKNIVDISSVITTVTIGFIFAGKIVGIGIGTLAAVLGVGRAIALVNKLVKKRIVALVE